MLRQNKFAKIIVRAEPKLSKSDEDNHDNKNTFQHRICMEDTYSESSIRSAADDLGSSYSDIQRILIGQMNKTFQ